jgi:short subunit dehydrogenase-like uncharacterized protein
MQNEARVLIYGATGYTGRLVARLAAGYGITPVLAARSAEVGEIARELKLEHRSFGLDDPAAIDGGLRGITVVVHCAGPFIDTSEPMASACIRNHVHYVDITGEIEVFEALHARDAEARAAGVTLMPGSGFDVVPSDCLAAYLKQRLPGATHLMLGIKGSGRLSRGTATTMVEHLDRGGMIRRGGRLTRVPPAWRTRDVDFGDGPRPAMTIPWGDIATAYYSTGIPNVEVYAAATRHLRIAARLSRYARPLLHSKALKAILKGRIRARAPGPDAHELMHGTSVVWGRVEDAAGNFVEGRVRGPNGYLLTAHAALLIAKRIITGHVQPGFRTPAMAYGPDLILEVPRVVRD